MCYSDLSNIDLCVLIFQNCELIMLHAIYVFMNRLECAVFIFLLLYFQRSPLSDNIDITTSVVVPCGGPKSLPVHRLSVVIFTFSVPLGP